MTVRRNAFGRQVDSFEEDVAARRCRRRRRCARSSSARRGSGGRTGRDGARAGEPGRPPVGSSPSVRAAAGHVVPPGVDRRRTHPRVLLRHGEEEHPKHMSGHSKWATTKHKKAAIDAKRGKLFAKLIKNIEVAARTGGGDPDGNPTLYDAIQKARKNSVPLDNIDRAVKRGSGAEAGGSDWQTIMYEGYGPSGVAVLIECLTDNRNRAASEVRTRDEPQRRFDGRPRLGVVPVQPQGRRDRRQGRPHRRRRAARSLGRRRRGGQRPRRLLRGGQRTDRPGRASARRCRTPASITSRPRRPSCLRFKYRWTRTRHARSCASSTRSRTPMTCRTSTPTSTCPTMCWRQSKPADHRAASTVRGGRRRIDHQIVVGCCGVATGVGCARSGTRRSRSPAEPGQRRTGRRASRRGRRRPGSAGPPAAAR